MCIRIILLQLLLLQCALYFVIQGYWTQFFPAFDKLKAVLREGVIGDPVVLRATMGANMNERAHALDPALGGGALIDLGCYTVMMAYVVLGKPESITAVCTKRPKGKTYGSYTCQLYGVPHMTNIFFQFSPWLEYFHRHRNISTEV